MRDLEVNPDTTTPIGDAAEAMLTEFRTYPQHSAGRRILADRLVALIPNLSGALADAQRRAADWEAAYRDAKRQLDEVTVSVDARQLRDGTGGDVVAGGAA